MAPPANMVPELIGNLLTWAKTSKVHPLVKSCIFHYEFEFIHPFADGNGRMGRMWNALLLYKWKPVFAWLPIETLIRERQDAYYAALGKADKAADATPFVEFLLFVIFHTLREISESQQGKQDLSVSVKLLFGKDRWRYAFGATDYGTLRTKKTSFLSEAVPRSGVGARLDRDGISR